METIIIQEFDHHHAGEVILDLRKQKVQRCTGCWSCWLKTPGACAQHDLDIFYRAFARAKETVFFLDIRHDFLTSNMKHLLDRMIPFALPYISFEHNESRHHPRYEKRSHMTFIYQDTFTSAKAEQQFIAYLTTVAHQFHMDDVTIQRYAEELL